MAVERGFKIATAYVEIVADYDGLRKSIRDELPKRLSGDADRVGQQIGRDTGKGIGKTLGPESEKSGRDSGGKLAKGMELSIVRNSPLIAAAVGGALVAGAPLALAGAVTLFGGVAAVAAAQSDSVRSAWVGTWDSIVAGMQESGQIIAPEFERMAARVGAAFDRLQPKLEQGFRDLAPQVRIFTDGVIGLGENALPGMFRAVERGTPVMQGFATFLETVGTGISDFFDAMSSHGPAAGEAFVSLGEVIGNLLPLLGELLGHGAELATIVLPPLATAVGVVADAAETLGPLLPIVATGFAGWKIAQTAAGWLTGLAGRLDGMAVKMLSLGPGADVASAGVGRVAGAARATADALPILGAAIAVAVAAYTNATNKGQEWAAALREGGDAADDARDKMSNFSAAFTEVNSGWSGAINALAGIGGQFTMTALAMDEAQEANEEYLASLNPVERAAYDLKVAEGDLADAIARHGAGSDEAAAAQEAYERASRENEEAQGELETALHGVTEAMIEQAEQAMASIDSGFAYRNALDDLEDSQAGLNDAINEFGAGSEEASRAQLKLEEDAYAVAEAFGRQQADLSGLSSDSAEYSRLVATEMLGELYRLRDAAGPEMAAAIQQQIDALEAGGVVLGETGIAARAVADRMRDLGFSVQTVPGYKGVVINAPTADQKQRITDLGYSIYYLPNKQVYITADTSRAFAALNRFLWAPALKSVPIIGSALGAAARGATGGNVGSLIRGFAGGGKLSGPGTRVSDSILAVSESGPIRVADDEWVINGAVSAMMGDRRMAALNAGRAEIVEHGAPPASAGGGRSITIERIEVRLDGTFDFTDPAQIRKAAEKFREEIVKIEREYR